MKQIVDLKELITKLGGQVRVAAAMGVRQQTVSRWLAAGEIPAARLVDMLQLIAARGLNVDVRILSPLVGEICHAGKTKAKRAAGGVV